MLELKPQVPPRNPLSARRDAAIDELLKEFAPSKDHELLMHMMINTCRLANDKAGRGELKIISAAIRELRYAFKVFAPYQDIHKVTIFGSARTPEDHPDYQQACQFAELMEREGWMVITGAGDGIMRAGHHGAKREKSFGVAISLPFEQETNDIIKDDPKLINFKYFFTRKLLFIKEAEAVVLFPGGFGTMDEGYETLTLVQTGKADLVPIVMLDAPGGDYWLSWREYVEKQLLKRKLISSEDMHLFKITDDPQVAVREITHFYRRYHSSRMVRDDLVVRLKATLEESFVEILNQRYGDIVDKGRMQIVQGPLPEEGNELPDLPRLVFKFNRKNIGRLRLMVDEINNVD